MKVKLIQFVPLFGIGLCLGVAGLESITYLGFISAHIYLPALIFYIFGLITLFYPSSLGKVARKLVSTIVAVFASTVSLLYFVLSLIESFTYENFVFTHFHINMKGFVILTALSILVYIFFSSPRKGLAKLMQDGLYASLIFLFIFNISRLTPLVIKSVMPIIRDPGASYDAKMTTAYPGFYPAMQMVARITSENSTIIIPPQGAPWVTEGNNFLVSRFLYPRHIVHIESEAKQTLPSGEVYMLIAKGSWPSDGTYAHGWPKISVAANQIWKFDVENQTYETFSRDYDPTGDVWDWGLIKVQNE